MLKLCNITKAWNKDTPNMRTALNGVSLSLQKGDFLTIIGGNGSGKSTLLNIVAGVFQPDAGTISLNGKDITHLAEHRRAAHLGRVFQDPLLGSAATMTIEENLALAARRGKFRNLRSAVTKAEKKGYQDHLAQLELGLENRMTEKVGLLSGGQRQALTLVMATLAEPELLLLDEHTAALDPRTSKKVMDISCKMIERNCLTTLMVTHSMKDAITYGNRLIMMEEGDIIFDAQGEEKQRLTVPQVLDKFQLAAG